MDAAAILVKIAGLVLFFFTARSVYKHVRSRMSRRRQASRPGGAPDGAAKSEHSKVEHALNSFLLYAWFVFMTAFSLGMVVNN